MAHPHLIDPAASLRRQRDVERLHSLGARPLAEFLKEIGTETGTTATIDRALSRWRSLTPQMVRAAGGDCFPVGRPLAVPS